MEAVAIICDRQMHVCVNRVRKAHVLESFTFTSSLLKLFQLTDRRCHVCVLLKQLFCLQEAYLYIAAPCKLAGAAHSSYIAC